MHPVKAMILKGPNEPFVLETMADPTPGPGEAVAKVLTCGAGLTIQHVRAGRIKVDHPRVIGHEFTGEIVALGPGTDHATPRLTIGTPVTSYFYLTCGRCHWCRIDRETLCDNFRGYVGREIDGAYAEYIKLPIENFIPLPEGLDYRTHPAPCGVITDAIATPYKLTRHAEIHPSDTVAVFGAGGGLGIHMLMLARWAHARRVIAVDVATDKFDACRTAGADDVVDGGTGIVTEALRDLTDGRGIDVAIDFVSSRQTLEAACRSLGKGGRLVTLGGDGATFEIDARALLVNEIQVMGSRYATKQEVIDSLELVARGEVWPLVTELEPLARAEALHQRVEQGLVTGRAALSIE